MRLEAFLDNVAWIMVVWSLGRLAVHLVTDVGAELEKLTTLLGVRIRPIDVVYVVLETVIQETPWPFLVAATAWLLA